ncbi:inositol monophosphatase family protein [Mariprofundus erugo]|uniref:inositol monophosphatase family protein n=1 Tax=Mariprofundus erugo TaxID=2528639 RepID=UPI0010FE0AEE|nr:inositol monophosphatase family protein [Mariprofundus erugo]TLS73531.1 inositol monophosphatase family protein [Mariprofundus erugo]
MAGIDIKVVSSILEEAGREVIMPAFSRTVHSHSKDDGSIVTETDLACQRFIESKLSQHYPTIAMLGEEMDEQEQRALLTSENKQLWCLDPLDGTTNFATNLPAIAISLALIEDGMPVLACIHDPVSGETFTAEAGNGAFLNHQPIRAFGQCQLADSVGFIDYKRLSPSIATDLAGKQRYRSQRNIGSCALEWAWLAAGRAQFIIHGGEKIWDFAAGSLIAAEAGCTVGSFTGAQLFPARHLSSSVLASASKALHSQLCTLLETASIEK